MQHPRPAAPRPADRATGARPGRVRAAARRLAAVPLALALAAGAAPAVGAAGVGTQSLSVEATVEQVVVDGPHDGAEEGPEDGLTLDTMVHVDGELYDVPDDAVVGTAADGDPVRTGDTVDVTLGAEPDLTVAEALAAAEDRTDPSAEVVAVTPQETAQGSDQETAQATAQGTAQATASATTQVPAQVTAHAAAASTAVLGAHTLVVLPVHWGTPSSDTRSSLTTLAHRAAQYWAEQTAGRLTLAPTVRDWARIPEPVGCVTSTMMREALAAHGEAPATRTRHVAVVFPARADCGGWAGKASIGGGNIWVNGVTTEDVLAHELGHNLGIGHADTATCTSAGVRIPLSAECTPTAYGDLADVMGIATTQASGNLNTALADALGLVEIVPVPSLPATIDLARLSDVTAPRALRLSTAFGTVYVDYRPAQGRDVRQPAWAGLQVHRVVGGSYPQSQLLDLRPTTARPFAAPSLPVGRSWEVPGADLTLTLTGATSSRATLTLSSTSATAVEPLALTGDLRFVPVTPTRLLDTRDTASPLGAGARRDLVVAGTRGIPPEARAVALNLTAVGATSATHLRAWPAGAPMPGSSVLNTDPGRVVASGVLLGVGGQGSVSVYNAAGQVHLVADVTGYYVPTGGNGFQALPAAVRVLDTRSADGAPVPGGGTRTVTLAGRHGVPADATAVVVNVTSVSGGDGHVVAYPAGATRPLASTVNHLPGGASANRATVRLGGRGLTFAVAGAPGHVVVDLVGWYGPTGDGLFTPVVPTRAFDTRLAGPAFGGGESRTLGVRSAGVPAGAKAAVMVLTATGATARDTYLTAWNGGGSRPTTSDLNVRSGWDQSNLAVVPVSSAGSVRVFNNLGDIHVIGDVLGYFD